MNYPLALWIERTRRQNVDEFSQINSIKTFEITPLEVDLDPEKVVVSCSVRWESESKGVRLTFFNTLRAVDLFDLAIEKAGKILYPEELLTIRVINQLKLFEKEWKPKWTEMVLMLSKKESSKKRTKK